MKVVRFADSARCQPHIVENALDTESVGLDIFVPGRSFDFWAERAARTW